MAAGRGGRPLIGAVPDRRQHGTVLSGKRTDPGYALVNAPFDTESPPAKYSVFALVLGCVFLSILITGGTLMTTRLFLYLSGLQ